MEGRKKRYRFFLERIRSGFRNMTVEPIIVLVYLGYVFGNTQQSPEIYRRICEIYYGNDDTVNCYEIRNSDVEDSVQKHSAEWSLYNSLAYLIPAIFADTILGAYGDRNGRQINILLGICGLVVSEYGYLLTLSKSAHTPYWSTLIFGLTTGLTGYIAMIPVSCYAYLADITDDSSVLTIRSGIFSVFQTLASVVGGLVAGIVHNNIDIAVAIDIELFMFLLAFIYTIWRVPQKPGLQEIDRRTRVKSATSQSSLRIMAGFFGDIIVLYKSAIQTYSRKRVGHRRAFMFITVVVLMLTYTTSVETRTVGVGGVINNYVFRRTDGGSLAWDNQDLGYWNGMGYTMVIIGTISGLLVFKKILQFRETTIILIGLLSSTLRTIMIGISVEDWMMYVANVVGMFSGLLQPAIVSFITQIVAGSEVGRTFSLFGIAADLAFIITAAVYTNIYRWTVDWSPGFTFFFIGALQLLAFIAMLWVHFQSKKEGIGKNSEQPNVLPIQKAISQIGEDHVAVPSVTINGPKPRMSKRQISIIEHAQNLAVSNNDIPLWGSSDDVRRERKPSVRFF